MNATELAFGFPGGGELFRGATFEINPSDRIGIVGRNGVGKTSLMRVLSGKALPSEGVLARRHGLRINFVEQFTGNVDLSLFDFIFSAHGPLADTRRELMRLESQLDAPVEYAQLVNEYGSRNGYYLEAEAKRILSGLGFSAQETSTSLAQLSSGQREKAALARGLLFESDVIFLDEPTNHLDIEARKWLEDYLSQVAAACMIVSHDRLLLTTVANRILQIEQGQIRIFEGNYDNYRDQRALIDRQAWERYESHQHSLAIMERASEHAANRARRVGNAPDGVRTNRDFYARKAGKISRTGRLLKERATRQPEVSKPWQEQPIPPLDFSTVPRSGEVVLAIKRLTKSFGTKCLFSELTFCLGRGEHVALAGRNGSGKTTLLRIILGLEQPNAGHVHFGGNVRVGYYSQEGENLDPAKTPLDICGQHTQARTLLRCLKLDRERLEQPLAILSAGEMCKVALVRLLLSGANLLLLDEPTNHLEIEAQEAIERALKDYPGAILVVSHDRRFVETVVSRSVAL